MGKKRTEKIDRRRRSALATVGAFGVATLLGLAAPGAAEAGRAAEDLNLVRDTARQNRMTGHPLLDSTLNNIRSVTAQSVCHTDSHSSSHTSGGGIDNHTSTRKRLLHQC